MKYKILRIISFLPFANWFCWFVYYLLLMKSSYLHKGKECVMSVITASICVLPIVLLWFFFSNLADKTSLMYSVIEDVYLYVGPLVMAQGLVWRMKKWDKQI